MRCFSHTHNKRLKVMHSIIYFRETATQSLDSLRNVCYIHVTQRPHPLEHFICMQSRAMMGFEQQFTPPYTRHTLAPALVLPNLATGSAVAHTAATSTLQARPNKNKKIPKDIVDSIHSALFFVYCCL